MRIKLLIIIGFCCSNLNAQNIPIRQAKCNVADSNLFFNKSLYLIKELDPKIKSFNLEKLDTLVKRDFYYVVNSKSYKVIRKSAEQETLPISLQIDSESNNMVWFLNVIYSNDVENISLFPIYCDGKILITQCIGVQKVLKGNLGYQRGHISTLVFKIG